MMHRMTRDMAIVKWSLVFLGLLLCAYIATRLPLSGDFLGYWSAARAALHGSNPYDLETLRRVQLATGHGLEFTIGVWNPPWTLPLLMPLALLPFAAARVIWALIGVLLLGISGVALTRAYRVASDRVGRIVGMIAPLLILNSWTALAQGQINLLVLAGISLALLMMRSNVFVAGLVLVLALVKPQLSVGAVSVLSVWAIRKRHWSFLLGLGVGISSPLILLTLLRPSWFTDYLIVLHTPLTDWNTPTMATAAKAWLPANIVVPLFYGLLASSLILIVLFAWRTDSWQQAGAAAIVTTMLFSPFFWSYDLVILLIPFYQLVGFGSSKAAGWRTLPLLMVMVLLGPYQAWLQFAGVQDDYRFVTVVPLFASFYLAGLLLTMWPLSIPSISRQGED